MTGYQWKRDSPSRPVVPFVDMDVCPADGRLENADEYLATSGLRRSNFLEAQAHAWPRLDQRFHLTLVGSGADVVVRRRAQTAVWAGQWNAPGNLQGRI